MSNDDPNTEYQGDARDKRLFASLGEATSPSHDAIVLENARAAGEQIAARSDNHSLEQKERRYRWLLPAGVCATAVVLATTVILLNPPTPPVDGYRGVAMNDVMPAHARTLAQPPVRLSWPSTPNARYYVEIRSAVGEILWNSEALSTNVLSVDTAAGIPIFEPGATYLWSIRITHESGESSLGPYWFTIGSFDD